MLSLTRRFVPFALGCLALAVIARANAPQDDPQMAMKKGYGVKPTGLKPVYPDDFKCSPITSPYATWIDVDGTRRDEVHTGIDAGRLGDWIVAPASGTVRAVWKADWKWGREGALLIRHDRRDVNLSDGPKYYYSEFDHLDFDEIKHLKEGQRVERGERLARVTRPGGNPNYLPEVHWEVWEVDDDQISWRPNRYGAEDWWNGTAALIDPLYMLGLNDPPKDGNVKIVPFVKGRDYAGFRGFTYILQCVPK
ncbi:M23 family metallopeptidase [Hyphomicrobium sp. B1]|jgi:murein DD-endopeptidase MepM/ murein hydrolase activator NlpD|uniref:M23 family metallopeptidase n=1 Tax=unclassified Hyphomicrobium TaxID=2619925 RepID=UPI003919EED5